MAKKTEKSAVADIKEMYSVYKKTIYRGSRIAQADPVVVNLQMWNYIQVEELSDLAASLYDAVRSQFPTLSLSADSLKEHASALAKALPKPVGEIVYKSLATDENEQAYGRTIDHSFLRHLDVLDVIEMFIVIIQQNLLNEAFMSRLGELVSEAFVTMSQKKTT